MDASETPTVLEITPENDAILERFILEHSKEKRTLTVTSGPIGLEVHHQNEAGETCTILDTLKMLSLVYVGSIMEYADLIDVHALMLPVKLMIDQLDRLERGEHPYKQHPCVEESDDEQQAQ